MTPKQLEAIGFRYDPHIRRQGESAYYLIYYELYVVAKYVDGRFFYAELTTGLKANPSFSVILGGVVTLADMKEFCFRLTGKGEGGL